MKKAFKAAAIVLVLLLALAALFACVQKGEVSGDSMTLVLDDQNSDPVVIQVDLNAMSYNEETGLMNVLQSLRLQEKLDYQATDSGYGAYLTAVGGLSEDAAAGRYISVYTSVEKDKATFEGAENYEFLSNEGSVICYPSGVGASAMSIEDGCVIVITYVTY